jgi:protein-disulfide isomerase
MKLLALALAALTPCIAASPDIEKGKITGNPNAPIRLEIFSDFQCPSCKSLHDQVLPYLLKDYVTPGKVYIVAREFPLPMHPYSREAASYAVAAARLGIYQPVADRLFETQAAWSASGKVWDSLSPILSADQKKKIQSGAKDPAVIAAVQQDFELAQRERVNSTPTIIFTKGTKKFPIPWPVKYSFLQSMLDGYLK